MANALTLRGYPTSRGPATPYALDGDRLRRAQQLTANTGGGLPPQGGVGTVNTGGPLPPQVIPPVNTGGPHPPQQGVWTGGPLPPQVLPPVSTGGGLPPSGGVGTVNTGGGLPPSGGVGTVNTGGGLPPSQLPPVNTGGPLPPSQYTLPALDGSQFVATATGGGQGASAMSTISQMAQQFAMQPGASATSAAQQIAAAFNTTPDKLPIQVVEQINAAFAQAPRASASATAMGFMDDLLSTEGSYITNARRRGLEQANSRGLMNSSVAAGSAQRAALDAAQPIFSEIMGLNSQREGQDFDALMQARAQAFGLTSDREGYQVQRDLAGQQLAGQLESQARDAQLAQARDAFNAAQALSGQREQNAFVGMQAGLDRTQGVNNALLGSELDARNMALQNRYEQERARLDAELRQQLQSDTTAQQDWLSDRQFTREFNGALSTMAIGGAYDLNNAILNYAASNPEVYTPEIISGMTNFFQMNMTGLLQQYFPQLMGGNG